MGKGREDAAKNIDFPLSTTTTKTFIWFPVKMRSRIVIFTAFFIVIQHIHKSEGVKCFLDTAGRLPPKEGEPLNTSSFKQFDCNLMGGHENVCPPY